MHEGGSEAMNGARHLERRRAGGEMECPGQDRIQVAAIGARNFDTRQKKATQGSRTGRCRCTVAQTGDNRSRGKFCERGGGCRCRAKTMGRECGHADITTAAHEGYAIIYLFLRGGCRFVICLLFEIFTARLAPSITCLKRRTRVYISRPPP